MTNHFSIFCCGRVDCQDEGCPGRRIAAELKKPCSVCIAGVCRTPQACLQPLPELPPRIERHLFTSRPDRMQVLRRIAIGLAIAAALLAHHYLTKGLL